MNKRYEVGPRYTYPNGDTGPASINGFKTMAIIAESPAKARKQYIEKTGYTGKVSAEFICMALV